MELVDRCLEMINAAVSTPRRLTYNKGFIGLNDGIRPGNFVTFRPSKLVLRVSLWYLSDVESSVKRLQESGLEARTKNDGVRVELTPKAFEENKQLITEMLQECAKGYEKS
jgi:hypothetical protein